MTRLTLKSRFCPALGPALLLAGALFALAAEPVSSRAVPATPPADLQEIRRLTGCLAAPTDDIRAEATYRGRAAIEIKGREQGGAGTMRDLAVIDSGSGRIVAYVCFANASTRKSGEAIVSLAEVSGRADRLVRAVAPGAGLELERIDRRRPGETDSIYYEAGYASASGEFLFLEPPVRLLLNATTGSLFRLEIDPDWLDPAPPPRFRISKKAAELIASVVLRGVDLAAAFGAGVALGKVAAAEMFTVHPNDWLGLYKDRLDSRARVAWVVPFRVAGGDTAGLHSLFVDAATGRVLGGLPGQSARPLVP